MSIRTAVAALISFVCGVVAGGLTFWMNGSVPGALLAGLAAMAFAFVTVHGRIR